MESQTTQSSEDYLKQALDNTSSITVKPVKELKVCFDCKVPFCSVCNVCHTPTCVYIDKAVHNVATAAKYRHLQAKTQKARGFVNLATRGMAVPQPYYLVLDEADIEYVVKSALDRGLYKMFVRPCPVRARHGFEESRVVEFIVKGSYSSDDRAVAYNAVVDQVRKIFAAANEADEEHKAELLLLPYVEAKHNLVITPSRMAIGPNHDGATAGYDSISVPLMGTKFSEDIGFNLVKGAGVGAHEDPYFEVVMGTDALKPLFTQIRAGAKLPPAIGADYVPAPMRVTEVVEAEGDLLVWEKQVKALKPGTVVVKLGGTLISHYGVHCLYNNVACFTSRRPSIGEVLDVVSVSPTPNPEAVIKGLGYGALVPVYMSTPTIQTKPTDLAIQPALIAMMAALHNAGAMSGDSGFWIGYSAAMMMRAGMAGSHGEARHKLNGMANQRTFVYKLALKDFLGSRNTLGTAQWMFENLKWSSSYGGPAWARCTQSIIDLDNAVLGLLNAPTTANVAAVVSCLNVAVNQAHNGGWWLNKFITQGWFDKTAAQSLESLAIAGTTMYKIKKAHLDVDSLVLTEEWKKLPPIVATPGGKLHVQLLAPATDQTIFSINVTDDSNVMCTLFSLGTELDSYTGAICPACKATFSSFESLESIQTDTTCGTTSKLGTKCYAKIGWAKDGECIVKTSCHSEEEEESSDYDEEPSEDEDPDGTELSSVKAQELSSVKAQLEAMALSPFKMPADTYISIGTESWPPVKSKGVNIKLSNVNGSQGLLTAGVTVAQCNFNLNLELDTVKLVHLQWQVGDMTKTYFSTSVHNITPELNAAIVEKIKLAEGDLQISWSGSGIKNYWPLEVVLNGSVSGEAVLRQPGLVLDLTLDLKTGALHLG